MGQNDHEDGGVEEDKKDHGGDGHYVKDSNDNNGKRSDTSNYTNKVNPLMLTAAKQAWRFWIYFSNNAFFWKIFEGEMLTRGQTTTLLQIF